MTKMRNHGLLLKDRTRRCRGSVFGLALFSTLVAGLAHSTAYEGSAERPYRVLVVIGDQWDDPGSYAIDGKGWYNSPSRESGKDFRDVVTMLKIWGIPFDILRLDQQRLQINRFLNGMAEPNYGCVVWLADPAGLEGASANYQTMRRVVEDYGMSLIALFDTIATPELAELVGVDYQGVKPVSTKDEGSGIVVSREHFITAGMDGTTLSPSEPSDVRTVRCTAKPGTTVLGTLEGYPQLVVRDVSEETKVVWIGGGHQWLGVSKAMRDVFRKSLVYGLGYGLFNDSFDNAFLFTMDDMGASEHAYSRIWHYPTPSKEMLVKYLVEPLEKHGWVISQYLTPGFANPKTRMVDVPWKIEKFTDPFGNVQDYPSTKEGLDEGVRRGVFEIHAHRAWTHMNWDLDSPPGPWWDLPISGERGNGKWYSETYDKLRGKPVPSNDMLFIYKTGRDAIMRQFGVTPLGVNVLPGTDLNHDNGRLAVIAGYGVDRRHYLGRDYVILLSIRDMMPEVFVCHDIDLIERTATELTNRRRTMSDEQLRQASLRAKIVGGRKIELWKPNWFEPWKNKRWIGLNEYCAYLHSEIDVSSSDNLVLQIQYDDHYCQHFANHDSQWTLELSDRYRKRLGQQVDIAIDGQTDVRSLASCQSIVLPPGTGYHTIDIRPK